MKSYKIIGLMSGTSLDGVDLVYAQFNKLDTAVWEHTILYSDTFEFPEQLLSFLNNSSELSGSQLSRLDYELGNFFAHKINDFISVHQIDKSTVDAIASHGQTIFHQPGIGYTVQIGNPAIIAVKTGIQTVGDFRTKDILYGGQGAPLVPIGDFYLFGQKAEAFVNIGGFSNISFKKNETIKAFDICPGNLPLNKLALSRGLKYDENGALARAGEINYFLLDLLNSLDYYAQDGPKSLGTEWLEHNFYPMLKFNKDIENNMATVVEHIAIKISESLNTNELKSVLITGGGAKNQFLLERIQHYYKGEIVYADNQLIDSKEALIFGLLGALHLANEPNCLASVTGASKNVCGGVLHCP